MSLLAVHQVRYVIKCDSCALVGPDAWTKAKAEEFATDAGWITLPDDYHHCPECDMRFHPQKLVILDGDD